MKGGFSFCGIDIADINLNYVPENEDTYVYAPTTANIHEETFEGHDGGYSYGSTKEPKTFILRCYYEGMHVAKGFMAKVFNLFKIGKAGLLIFARRPWCYYYATVTDIQTSEMYNYENGLVVVTMKAYYPLARGLEVKKTPDSEGHMFYNLMDDPYHNEIMNNTGMFDKEFFMPPMSFGSSSNPITSQKIVLLYNPGTERAKVNLVISGTAGDGVTIVNRTTEQRCRYVAFSTSNNEYIYTDAINGKTIIDDGIERRLAFLYHDYGFIELEPSFPIVRNIFATYNGTTVTVTNMLYQDDYDPQKEWYIDKYIYLDGWYKILRCEDPHTITVVPNNGAIPGSGKIHTNIVLMNEIVITPTQGASLTKLNFIYKPTYS